MTCTLATFSMIGETRRKYIIICGFGIYLFLTHRKWRLKSFIGRQKSESRFMKRFEDQFGGPEATSVFLGDWSAGRTLRGQIPSKSKGFRKMFAECGYGIWLVDEFRTSALCSGCHGRLDKGFKSRVSPKPWRDEEVKVHGLLRCQSQQSVRG